MSAGTTAAERGAPSDQGAQRSSSDAWRGIGRDGDDAHVHGGRLHPSSRRLLASLLRGRGRGLAAVSSLLVLRNAVAVAMPIMVKIGIDRAVPALADHGDRAPVLAVLGALCALAVVQAGTDFASTVLMGRIAQDMLLDLRCRVFAHVQRLGLAFHERFTSGRVISRLTNDIENIDELLSSGLLTLVWAALSVGTTMVVLVVLDWRLAMAIGAFVPALVASTAWYQRNAMRSYRQTRETAALVIMHFVESLRSVAAVQAFRREERNEAILEELNERYRQAKQRGTRLNALYGPGLRLIGNCSVALVLLSGGLLVLRHEVTVGTLAAFVLYLRRMLEPIMDLSQFYSQYQSAAAAAEKLGILLDEQPTVREPDEPLQLLEARGAVAFRHVTFGYSDDRPILSELDLEVPCGQTVAVVGATGAGKSTIARLLARFYDAQAGTVELDGVDVRRIRQDELRRHVIMVTQENFLFSGTIADNIAFGRPGASRAAVEAAAEAIGADRLVASLPDGYDTMIGTRGAHLSAGQRQLVSFARAFIADPRVLILDEATSSLDIPTERMVQRALSTLLASRTAIVIAHRLSTVEIADRVIVLEGGRIVEDGSPSSLRGAGGPYQRLHEEWRRSL